MADRPPRRPSSANRTAAQRQTKPGPRAAPRGSPADLQRRLGNSGTQALLAQRAATATTPAPGRGPQPLIQPKLTVGPANDVYEREADTAARSVTAGQPVQRLSTLPATGPQPGQRLCAECEEAPVQRRSETPSHAAPSPSSGAVQRASAPAQEPGLDIDRAAAAMDRAGSGAPLEPSTRARMEHSFGADFHGVRVHTDPAAHEASASLNARAFTRGSNIYLARGQSADDQSLLAHELAHTVHQDGVLRRLRETTSLLPPPSPSAPPATESTASAAPLSTAPPRTAPRPGPATRSPAQQPGVRAPEAPPSSAEAAVALPVPAPATAPSVPSAPMGGGGGPELLMPEPPSGLTAADQARLAQVEQNAATAATAAQDLPSAAETTAEAREAVQEPEAETAARAAGELAANLGEQAAPSPEIEELCERIKSIIRSKRPPDEESLVKFDPKKAAQEAGGALSSSVQGGAQQVQGNYAQINEQPQGAPQQEAQPLTPPPARAEIPTVGATQAVPDAVPAENVSLDADVAASRQRIGDAGMATQPAELITDPSNPVVQAREAQGELGEMAQRAPEEVLAEQAAIREQARGEMQSLQAQALAALQGSRTATVRNVTGAQRGLGSTEEEMRRNAGAEAQRIFNNAQTEVNRLLQPLPQTAMRRWETGVQVLSTRVEQQSAEFESWKRERYKGLIGTGQQVIEFVTGLPDWAIDWLNSIEANFGNGVCALLREISTEVNTVIATCEEIIDNANRQIAELFARLPPSLQTWAAGEQARFGEQLQGLRDRAHATREDFNQQLSENAAQSVQQVRERIHEMRQDAQGLLGRLADAINQFIDDPAKFIIEGLLKLVGIPPASFWALVDRIGSVIQRIADDPLTFANNLAAALGQGFQKFFDNFKNHVIGGFFEWLFSGLGSVGVQIPKDFSLGSLITFFLQLMGITWARIRTILAKHIGEKNVALIEKAYELISTLIERGPEGIFEMIKEQLNPQTILDAVLQAAVDFLIEALIKAVTARIIAMFNPAGAIIQAIEVIYRILDWIFKNAARIFALVETIVNGAADLIAGNTGGMATAVEGALARLIAPVIDFLAGFLGLGDLPEKIAETIGRFQEMVLGVIERVVAWLAERARNLLKAIGVGESPEDRLRLGKEAAVAAVNRFAGRAVGNAILMPLLTAIKVRYGFRRLEVVPRNGRWHVVGEINPDFEEATESLTPESHVPSEEGKTLLVGEGNFSFALSIAAKTHIGNQLIATDFVVEERQMLETSEDEQQRSLLINQNIAKLQELGVQVERQVDATNPESYPAGKFDIIVFNHPLVLTRDAKGKTIRGGEKNNIILIESFIKSAKEKIKEGGRIIVISSRFRLARWKIDEIADKLNLEQHVMKFISSEFPGYMHEKTMRAEGAETITTQAQFAIVFSLSSEKSD